MKPRQAEYPEVVYYDSIISELVISLAKNLFQSTSRGDKTYVQEESIVQSKTAKLLARLPKAIAQLRNETNKLPTKIPQEKSEKARWMIRVLLFECLTSYVEQTGNFMFFRSLMLESDKIRYVLEKSVVVLEEYEDVLLSLRSNGDQDPLLNVLRENLALHVEEAFDIERVDISILSHQSAPSSVTFVPSQLQQKNDPLSALDALQLNQSKDQVDSAEEHCQAFFLAHIDKIARQCSVKRQSSTAPSNHHTTTELHSAVPSAIQEVKITPAYQSAAVEVKSVEKLVDVPAMEKERVSSDVVAPNEITVKPKSSYCIAM